MKKLLALLLVLAMCLSLAACGGEEEPADDNPGSAVGVDNDSADIGDEEPADDNPGSAVGVDNDNADISDEELAALMDVYNRLAPIYNEAYNAATANGWLEDETTAAEIQALNNTLGFISAALTEDLSMLDGTDFDTLINNLQQMEEPLNELLERVSTPYGEG